MFFADLKGSLELLADHDPEESRKILNAVLEEDPFKDVRVRRALAMASTLKRWRPRIPSRSVMPR